MFGSEVMGLQSGVIIAGVREGFAGLGFLLLFPGFILYHFSLAALRISPPPILDGGFGIVALLTVLVLGIFAIRSILELEWEARFPFYVVLVFAFFSYAVVWSVLHYLFIDASYIWSAFVQVLQTVVLLVATFLVGWFVPIGSIWVKRVITFSFLAILAYLLVYVAMTGEMFFYGRKWFGVDEGVASYQGFARSMLVISLFLIAVKDGLYAKVFVTVFSVFVLFVLGARSEFSAFVAVTMFACMVFLLKDPRYPLLIGAAVIVCAVGIFANSDIVLQSRQLELLDLSESSSFQRRVALQSIAVDQIIENPLRGQFGGHVAEGGSTGAYAHNALSAWVSFGVMGFLLYIGLTVQAVMGSAIGFIRKGGNTPTWTLSLLVNVACLVLMVGAKSIFWPLPGLGWGLYVQARLRKGREPEGDGAMCRRRFGTAIPL